MRSYNMAMLSHNMAMLSHYENALSRYGNAQNIRGIQERANASRVPAKGGERPGKEVNAEAGFKNNVVLGSGG